MGKCSLHTSPISTTVGVVWRCVSCMLIGWLIQPIPIGKQVEGQAYSNDFILCRSINETAVQPSPNDRHIRSLTCNDAEMYRNP